MVKRIFHIVLIAAYVILALWGFLSGMLSEGLIGSTHPAAGVLADAMMWQGLLISMTAIACPLIAQVMKSRTIWRRVVQAVPFLMLAVQIVLATVAEGLA